MVLIVVFMAMKLCRLHGNEGSASAANGVLEANKRVFFDGLVDLCIVASINVLPFITTGGCKPRHIFVHYIPMLVKRMVKRLVMVECDTYWTSTSILSYTTRILEK